MAVIYSREKSTYDQTIDRLKKVYRHEPTDEVPFIVSDVNYWLDGAEAGRIPEDYYTNPKAMTNYQLKRIEHHLSNYEDAYVPMLFPWYGTGVVPSALGCSIKFHDYGDPSVEGRVLKAPEDIRKLKKPDPYKDGIMPRVLETIDYMKANTDLPISFTDPQGPLNIAICLCGLDNLFVWMYTAPDLVHEIMAFSTEVFIDWVRVQKEHIGDRFEATAFPQGIVLPKEFGNIWIADDDCVVMSADMYETFVVPYNSQVLKAFGGGTIHFCGSARHQIQNFLKTEGCTGVNNFCMGDFEQIYDMQEAYEDKMALMVCDFTPLDVEDYYKRLFSGLKKKGTIVASFISHGYALVDGKYKETARDTDALGQEVYRVLDGLCSI